VCLSWDIDNESFTLAAGDHSPIMLSWGEYGAKEGLDRILQLHDKYGIPATFFIPAVSAIVSPQMIEEFRKRPQHEVGIHGWIHENVAALNDREEERRLLLKSVAFWQQALGKRPVGYRAPYFVFSKHTLQLLKEAGFEYDSSAMSMSVPYEIQAFDQPTGLVEIPPSWIVDDAPYLYLPGGSLPSPRIAFEVFREDFDRAYEEGTLFVLTMHPMITGRRVYMGHLEELVNHMKSKPGVWFATAQQIADYVKPGKSDAERTQNSRYSETAQTVCADKCR
jgi:peptidoglycan/xylan/chitin deacetylase (PgdA/CDA1 family)